ncbi:MAG: DUF1854 domain-containing protein [Clostridia bacterium]|nr:DUF1854 domain-containing protein [Clostridia bacterium]
MGRIYIDKYTGRIEQTDIYRVRVILKDGTVLENLEPRRLFPLSNLTMYITLLDETEQEIAFVRDFEELDDTSRKALESCFSEYYMIPKITHLISSNEKFGSLKWLVKTDRGDIAFRIRNRHSDIKLIRGSNRILIRDSNDNRYEIPDYTLMDMHSQHLLFSYL